MYQMLPSLSNVYVSNVTANVNVHAPYVQPIPAPYGHQVPPQQQQPPPQQMFSHGPPEGSDQGNRSRRQRQKAEKKREGPFVQSNEVISPSLDGHPPPQFPNIPPMPPYYLPGAPGAPVYMQHAILPVYPSPLFTPYSHTPGPMVYPQTNNIEHGAEDYNGNVQQSFSQENSEMIVVGCEIRSENSSDQRRGVEENGNNYNIEELSEQAIPEVTGFKSGSENSQFHEESADGQLDQTFVSQQNSGSYDNSSKRDLSGNIFEKKEKEVESDVDNVKQITFGDQTAHLISTSNEDPNNLPPDVLNKSTTSKKKTNGELDVNNVDKVSVNSNSSATAWANDGHSSVLHSGTNNVKLFSSASAQVVKAQESLVPASQQSSEFPLIRQGTKSTRFALAAVEPEPASNQINSSSGGKSWASLFNKQEQLNSNSGSDVKGRPLARVLPYEVDTPSTGLSSAGPSSTIVPSASVKVSKLGGVTSNGPLTQETVTSSDLVNDPYLYNLGGIINCIVFFFYHLRSVAISLGFYSFFLSKKSVDARRYKSMKLRQAEKQKALLSESADLNN